jgi:hypothetical protein
MNIVARTARAIVQLLGALPEAAAAESGVIRRRRKFTASTLARTFILGYLQKPDGNAEHLAHVAAQCDVTVTPQAIDRRQTPRLARFLETLFRHAVRTVLGSDRALAPLLERFTGVTVLDSTAMKLPDSQRDRFPGRGGSHGGGQATLRLQAELDLKSGALSHVEVEPGRTSDGGSVRQHAPRPAGSLRITDLGYFSVSVFAALVAGGSHFLSRLHFKTSVRTEADQPPLDLLGWLRRQPAPWVDAAVLLGPERLASRLIAWRLPPDRVAQVRRKLRQTMRDKEGREPSELRLAWCEWTILVTSLPATLASPAEAAVLYRARWQIELLFKRWKSQNLVADLSGCDDGRQMVRLWARLVAAVVQHWLIVTLVNGQPTRSWNKLAEIIRTWVNHALAASLDIGLWQTLLTRLQQLTNHLGRRNHRSHIGAFELLNQPTRLDFRLS